MFCRDALRQRAGGPRHGGPGNHAAVAARLSALEARPRMSLSRLDTRVAHLEARRARAASPSGPVVVWMADGDTRATALQKAGLTPAAVAGRTMLFVQYEEERPDALSPHNTAATPGSPVSSCG
jgi:hypothetical protein